MVGVDGARFRIRRHFPERIGEIQMNKNGIDWSKLFRWLVFTIVGCAFLNSSFVLEYLIPYNWVLKFAGILLLFHSFYIVIFER